jgi:hypothetical protein
MATRDSSATFMFMASSARLNGDRRTFPVRAKGRKCRVAAVSIGMRYRGRMELFGRLGILSGRPREERVPRIARVEVRASPGHV